MLSGVHPGTGVMSLYTGIRGVRTTGTTIMDIILTGILTTIVITDTGDIHGV